MNMVDNCFDAHVEKFALCSVLEQRQYSRALYSWVGSSFFCSSPITKTKSPFGMATTSFKTALAVASLMKQLFWLKKNHFDKRVVK
jgi:hypothetical protein